jgi:GNAT superfamily N-acetyltransferase
MRVRTASISDLDACLAVQRTSAIKGYATIFPQEEYPFPDDVVRAEWLARFVDGSQVLVADSDAGLLGTVTARPPRLEALFVLPRCWGSGVSDLLHDAALALIAGSGHRHAELDVMVDNARARRFYERCGWVLDGRSQRAPYPPYPGLVGYRRALDG